MELNASLEDLETHSTKVIQNAAYDCTALAAFGRHRRSSPKLVRVSLWETVERVTASKELINRPFRGFPEQASIVAKKHPASSPILFSFSRAIDMLQDFFPSFFPSISSTKGKKNFYQITMNLSRWNICSLYNLIYQRYIEFLMFFY